ncbi:MAG: dihydrolipoamide acetyltransferase family protein [Atribacterota bacterium]|nr:dihydrolipoamide acetyltransferase family protein [Atribacterota bacterium]MDD4896120.1 dihydrolipoamide acetyltransferase family protein [Atribacterota bacterium]MDD5637334.1 dihydrolipoamide acetyltransferase family protein [Atribacterota bacterium]
MVTRVIVPQKGLSDESCLIQEWKKKEGERVEKGEIICAVETNKAVFEIESPVAGILLRILYKEGKEVPVMETIAIIGELGEEYQHLLKKEETKKEVPLKSETVVGKTTLDQLKGKGDIDQRMHIKISPRAHTLAITKNLDISILKGSGPEGRIIERDVQEVIQTIGHLAMTTSEKKIKAESYQKIPMKGIRKIIAERMLSSIQNSAQLTLHSSFSAERVLEYRAQLKETKETLSYPDININHLIMFGIIKALKNNPAINSYAQERMITQFKEVHLGFAVDTAEGLKVPVLHQAEQYSLLQFARKVQQLTQQCIDRNIQPEDLEGGTFTITNLGNLGVEYFTPILNAPQTGIIGIGCPQLRPIKKTNVIEFSPYIGLSLTFDHRVIDGAPAARFLQQVIAILENFSYQPDEKP